MLDYINNIWLIAALSLLYIGILFTLATWGNKLQFKKFQPYIYSLTLAIFCTSWAFYGVIQQTISTGWLLAPTYLGAILLITFGWKIIDRIIQLAKQENSATISDFIAARYGHARGIATLVSIFCLVGIIPYIALQLKAVTGSFQIITGTSAVELNWYSDPTFLVAALMAVFSILFGARKVDPSESHQGMMLAIAFESIVKLVAFLAVGLFAVYGVYDGFGDIFSNAWKNESIKETLQDYSDPSIYLVHTIIGAIAIIALPRQFHVAVVEYNSPKDLKTARWMFPLYLILINLFVLPVALVVMMQPDMLPSLSYITLELPMHFDQDALALLAYIGGLSAGTSMVIIASITLATMMCNEIILPTLIKLKVQLNDADLTQRILNIRRVAIVIILLLAFSYYRLLTQYNSLSDIGLLSFVAIAQFAPAILIGLMWQGANRNGAYWGLITGFVIWCYCLFLPLLANAGWISNGFMGGIFGIKFLQPYALFGFDGLNPVVHGTLWSLFLNTFALIIASLYHRPSFSDQEQAQRFVGSHHYTSNNRIQNYAIKVEDLQALLQRFVSQPKIDSLFNRHSNPLTGRLIEKGTVNKDMFKAAERLLNSVLGRKGSDLLLRNLLGDKGNQYNNLNSILDEVSEVMLFNRDILNSALQSLNHGITVIDENLNLIAWNQKFQALYDFPPGFLYIGLSAKNVVHYIAKHGGYGKEIQTAINMRMNEVRSRTPLHYVRQMSSGQYIEMRGQPMNDGRYVTIYNDITEFRDIENKLRKSNEVLEERVNERTQELSELNTVLQKTNKNKTRFLAAAGHDLVQPLNSASLFSASILNKLNKLVIEEGGKKQELLNVASNLEKSLNAAESLLSELLEISKLDADIIKPNLHTFAIKDVMDNLIHEFLPLAEQKGIELSFINSKEFIHSDSHLLRRILQNLLSNALRYTQQGKILFGVRRKGDHLSIEIHDTGVGMKASDLEHIFEEFHRLSDQNNSNEKGLGLGLSIVQRIANLLHHKVQVRSTLGKGSCFTVEAPLAQPEQAVTTSSHSQAANEAEHSHLILCIDNEQQIIDGMGNLLSDWGYDVITATNMEMAAQKLSGKEPTLAIVDYHLDDGITGVEVMQTLQKAWANRIPCLVITADYTLEVKNKIEQEGYYLLKKPVKAMALRPMINSIISGF